MHVIVPIKRFEMAKQRLSGWLDQPARRQLSQAMASWTLRELAKSRRINGVTVVTAEPSLRAQVAACGFELLDEPEGDHGLNAALSAAVTRLKGSGKADVGIVHADIPLFSVAEFDRMVMLHRSGRQRQVTLQVDRHGRGTNVRLCRPPEIIPCLFGPSSAQRHELHARSVGVHVAHLASPTLSLDLDQYDDVRCILDAAQVLATPELPPAIALLQEYEMLEV